MTPLRRPLVFKGGLYCLLGLALNGSAQQLLFQPDNNPMEEHPWRLEKIPEYDWTRHFRIGSMAGFGAKADFKFTGTLTPTGNAPGFFDDGNVQTDSSGNSGGMTSFWGYQNASQLSGSSISMHDTTGLAT